MGKESLLYTDGGNAVFTPSEETMHTYYKTLYAFVIRSSNHVSENTPEQTSPTIQKHICTRSFTTALRVIAKY